jgi:lysylphosphatidylglycerol synthetase-like protein (DUF2156 family)
MSLPGLMANPIGQVVATAMNPIEAAVSIFNSNPYFIGIMMLILNLGGRFLILEVTKGQEQFFQNPWVRRVLIFIVLFVATRNIITAFWLTIIVVLVLGYLFNENSALCVFKGGRGGSKCAKKEGMVGGSGGAGGGNGLTPDEQDILRRLSEKQMRYASGSQGKSVDDDEDDDVDASEIYMANMELLHGRLS